MAPYNLPQQARVLIVGCGGRDGREVQAQLTSVFPNAATCRLVTIPELTSAIVEEAWDVAIVDCGCSSPASECSATVSFLVQWLPESPTIVVLDSADEFGTNLLSDGAWDVLQRKDVHRLSHVVTHALQNSTQRVARREAEGDRARSEERYRQVFLNASDPMFVFPLSGDGNPGRFTDVNMAGCAMLGYESDEFLRLSPPDLASEADRPTLPAKFRALISEKRQHVELQLVAKDGRHIPVEISGTLFKFGSQPTVLGVVTDVTGKRRAAQMYREATDASIRRHHIRAAVDGATIALVAPLVFVAAHWLLPMLSIERWLRSHPTLMDLFIAALFVCLGSTVFAFRRYGDLRRQIAKRRRVEETLKELQGQLEARVQLRTAELVNTNQTLAGEIADREKAEATLRLQAAALRVSPDAIAISDRDGRIVWLNPAFTALTGYTVDEAVGQRPRDLIVTEPEDQALYDEQWNKVLAGQEWRGELRRRRKDGSKYVEYNTVTPVRDAEGAITHFVSIKRDLTEEMHLKEKFLHAQKMESVGRLAGGIAHDFNNLLTVINGTAELASAQLTASDPVRDDFAEIYRAGTRAAALTRQLLAFSRRQVMKPQVLSLTALVGNMRSLVQRVIGEDITLVIPPASAEGVVMADPGQIEQVLMNLVVNARDAMPSGGTVTIDVSEIETGPGHHSVDSLDNGSYVVLSVADTGIGMSEETRTHLFEPFFTTKDAGKGTGLGLATVYGIVTQSGGSIRVASEVARGTTFRIYLPHAAEAAKAQRTDSAQPSVTGTETILVVEDEPALREMLRRMLSSGGYRVLTAPNGTEGLMQLERHPGSVDLLLTDVVMPGMSGPELASRVALVRPRTKVLFSSGYADNAAGRQAQRDRRCFIGKPYTRAEMLKRVRDILDTQDACQAADYRAVAMAG